MSVGKALALGAVVFAAATHSAEAGAIGQSGLAWITWAPNGLIQTSAAPASAPATTASLFGLGSSPYASTAPAYSTAPAPAPASYAPAAVAPVTATAASFSQSAAVPAPQQPVYDAFLNLGTGPYPAGNYLTTGGAQPWYASPGVAALFGGTPTGQQQAQFTQAVLQHVEQAFNGSGVPITLTTDPSATAAHTLSVVSGTTSTWGPVLGLTNIGSNGFDFIDQAAKTASNVNQLEWIVAHNVSHELMLAFGVPENYDQTGDFIDARNANLSMMLNPNATFSQSASQALLAQNFLSSNEPMHQGAQVIGPQPVPEPSTIAAWAVALGGIAVVRCRRGRSAA